MPAVVFLLGSFGLGCMSVKYCHEESPQPGPEDVWTCMCSPKMGNCNVNCEGRACDATCDNKKACDVSCSDSPSCEVRASSESLVVDCAGAEACMVNCQETESCEVDCAGADCYVDCPAEDCLVRDCDLDSDDCLVTCGGVGGVSSEYGTQDGNDVRCG